MRKRSLQLTAIVIVIIFSGLWMIAERSDSYADPQEALLVHGSNITLIPAHNKGGEILFFFIKDSNKLGASVVQKDLFGWEAAALTYAPMDVSTDNHINGYQMHEANVIYGVIRSEDVRIRVNGDEAAMLDLASLPADKVQENGLDGLFIWYYKRDNPIKEGKIELLEKNNGEKIDVVDL